MDFEVHAFVSKISSKSHENESAHIKNNRFPVRVETKKLVFGSSLGETQKLAFWSRLGPETDFLDSNPGLRRKNGTKNHSQ